MTQTETPWYDSHENLTTLAEWIRTNHGWNYFKNVILDVLEKPWKWEKEWRLASGDVDFNEVVPDRAFTPDRERCGWCDSLVGYVTYEDEFGPQTDWRPTFLDRKTGDYACDDCVGMAKTA